MRLLRLACGAGVVAELLLPRPARADVRDYLGRPIASVTIRSEGRTLTDAHLSSLIETTVGQPLDMRAVRESMTHLFSLAVYEDVQVLATASGTGVSVVYELLPLHPVESIQFVGGGPGIDDGRLRQLLLERFGTPPPAPRASEMAREIEVSLRDSGYLRASVTPRAQVQHAPERTTLTFTIEPGSRTRIGSVSVEGDPGVAQDRLLSQLGLRPGTPYERARLNGRIESYLADRRRAGRYEARLSTTPTFVDDDRTVNLRIDAEQGPLVRIVFAGDAVPSERHEEFVPIAREGSVDEDLLEDSTNRIEGFFRTQGFRDATAPHSREERAGELIVTFTVRKGGQYRVDSVELSGNSAMSTADLSARLRVRAGQPFSAAALDADVRTAEESFRRLGYPAVQVEPEVDARPVASDGHVPVVIRIRITENVQTLVDSVRITGNTTVPDGELRQVLTLAPGQPFSTAAVAQDRDAIELKYANLGFQSATVETRPGLSVDGRRANVVFNVSEGPRSTVDHVLVVGNQRTKTEAIERELRFKAGDPLGLEAISESQRRLAALGLFRRARITQLGRGDLTKRDVLVTVEEAPLTTLGYGGGFEVRSKVVRADPAAASEKLEFAPRASFEIGRRNLFGTNRSVNLFTSASLHDRDSPVFANQDQPSTAGPGGYGFPEYRLLGQFREPRIFGSNADFRVTGTFEQQIRSSFNFSRRGAAAEVALRLPRHMSASGGYQIQRTRVFNQLVEESQQRDIDRLFPKVRLSSFVGSLIRDSRNDPVDPTNGQYVSANGQIAARAIGSEVGFFKSFFTAQSFRTLPRARGTVFAASARLGAAVGFPSAAGSRDLPASERFFAGGDTTVRGFALDRLGVRHTPARESDTLDDAGFPLGGNSLLLLNGELRMPITQSVRVVGFADVGNVFKTVSDLGLGELRPAVGGGLRYKSPVGPLRFDLGFKTPKRIGESRVEWFITFGEAF
jgi:outer membrane protein insertion porin family